MKIKIDLAAFEALTQEQMLALAASEMNCHPDAIKEVRMSEYTAGDYRTLRWWMAGTGDHAYMEVTDKVIVSAGPLLGKSLEFTPTRWATIELLAEYNVITFRP